MSGKDDDSTLSRYTQFTRTFLSLLFDAPATLIKGTAEKFQGDRKTVPYYHRRFNRVPTIDECYTDDVMCRFEADQQFKRDKKVDNDILFILRKRWMHCVFSDYSNRNTKCKVMKDTYNETSDEWMLKYGHLPVYYDVVNAFMKQKHRMVHERRMREKGAAEAEMVDGGGEMM
ncbi:NADH dehydrogenase [ubiquinone] 1 beta subcomplex subunit 10-like [Mizuhopecten yessoensis]|uniref:NADH dehydrogenase [ubiquinone] 1 beta subcomplex subunit 10 n=1 Tax=Mizuhopecten yessoensis TaxID=6573 RepID=A0A210QIG0_MIZYE|nr:NADH dehydrogenase [ubiquinone] 1 beta subcomplex subunit 10-like [Mizuhopecten yessoensis]OWF48479.1 NADH dehydrogenase [ubiquinone] 1 beta subcomplex subunit 10 [Mizuhopecten yessoensis]